MDQTKPHNGRIRGRMHRVKRGKWLVIGRFLDHSQFAGRLGQTSFILRLGKKDERGAREIETINSRYTWLEVKGE